MKRTPSKSLYIVRCLTCGKEFKSQGIGPHQRSMKHEGKERVEVVSKQFPVPMKFPEPETNGSGLTLRILPIIVVEDENGRRGLLEWENG